ncbi:amino acid permease [Sphaerisporangium flaviroseum]|uniref:Amino acid permease n=2 Tax=Sphaerisporangium flaviroseum TaxID=509199 RepID=A0ABP7HX84_9ACTN
MAPTLALSLNGSAPAALVGKAVPLVFILGGIGIAFIAYGFAVLTRRYNHAGSAYALVGATLGPRAGFFSGFALLGYYILSTVCTVPASALFTQAFLESIGVPHVPWLLLGVIAAVGAAWLTTRDTRMATRTLLVLEGIGVALIAFLIVVVFAKLGGGTAPSNQSLDLNVFTLPAGTEFSAVAAATVFACLSWAGFESIATLGEETANPRRNIPRALIGIIALSLPVFVIVMVAETNGFGTGDAGVAAFAKSSTPLGDLAESYVGLWAARALLFVAMAGAFASLLASCTAASRMLFAFSRDGFGPSVLSRLSRSGAPAVAAISTLVVAVVISSVMAFSGTTATDSYFYYATLGVLCLLVAYGMVGIAAAAHLVRRRVTSWLAAIPAALGTVFAGYVFYVQSTGQSSPYNLFPYFAGAWCILGLVVVLLRPSLAVRIGAELARAELDSAEAGRDAPAPDISGAADVPDVTQESTSPDRTRARSDAQGTDD